MPEKQSEGAIANPALDNVEGDSDQEENEEGWEDAEPDLEEETPIICLFCPEKLPSPAKLFEHCEGTHQFDFKKTRKALGRLRDSIMRGQRLLIELFVQTWTSTVLSNS